MYINFVNNCSSLGFGFGMVSMLPCLCCLVASCAAHQLGLKRNSAPDEALASFDPKAKVFYHCICQDKSPESTLLVKSVPPLRMARMPKISMTVFFCWIKANYSALQTYTHSTCTVFPTCR